MSLSFKLAIDLFNYALNLDTEQSDFSVDREHYSQQAASSCRSRLPHHLHLQKNQDTILSCAAPLCKRPHPNLASRDNECPLCRTNCDYGCSFEPGSLASTR
jgi:hypothetical protein